MSVRGPRPHLVSMLAAVIILVATAFRAWVVSHSWFRLDDFYFIDRSIGAAPTPAFLLHDHAGHLMPAGFLLSWTNAQISPLDFAWPATELMVMYVVTCAGMYAALVALFGRRPGILLPLVLFCFSPILLPATTWWAAGVNQLPALAAILWALAFHVCYLRTGETRWTRWSVAAMVVGLLFCERTLIGYLFLSVVTLCYFTAGPLPERIADMWRRRRSGLLHHVALIALYLLAYLPRMSTGAPSGHRRELFPTLAQSAVAFGTAAVGGPGRWDLANVFEGVADPTQLVRYAALALLLFVVVAAARSRSRSMRAWLLPIVVLVVNTGLLASTRVSLVGPSIGREYRYLTETAAAFALAVGLAFLPVREAVHANEIGRPHWFFDRAVVPIVIVAAFVAAAAGSTYRYMAPQLESSSARAYFDTLRRSLAAHPGQVDLMDQPVPARIMSPFGAPGNFYAHMFKPLAPQLVVPEVTRQQPYVVDTSGHLSKVLLTSSRRNEPGPAKQCGYRIGALGGVVRLDGPVQGFGWFMRVGFLVTAPTPITVEAGDAHVHAVVASGLGALTFPVGGSFDSLRISGLAPGAALCTDDVTVGVPQEVR